MEDIISASSLIYILSHPECNLSDIERSADPSLEDQLKFIELKEGNPGLPTTFEEIEDFPTSAGILSLPVNKNPEKQLYWFEQTGQNLLHNFFIRPVYLQLFNTIWDHLEHRRNVVIEGNPGIGKTYFLLFFLLVMIQKYIYGAAELKKERPKNEDKLWKQLEEENELYIGVRPLDSHFLSQEMRLNTL